MITKVLMSLLFSTLLFSTTLQAKQTVSAADTTQKHQQVCKGKSIGTPVSFAYKGVIWNGSCETQFFPASQSVTHAHADEKERLAVCSADPNLKSAHINGQEIKGKCVLAFLPPQPQ